MTQSPRGRPPSGYLLLGRLGKTFQLAGALRFRPLFESAGDALEHLETVFVTGAGRLRLRDLQHSGGDLLVLLEGVRDRTAAQALVNAEVYADPADLPPELVSDLNAGDPEQRLTGLEVRSDGARVGAVRAAHFGRNDYVEVDLDGGGMALIPLSAPYVSLAGDGIDLIDPPAGLLVD